MKILDQYGDPFLSERDIEIKAMTSRMYRAAIEIYDKLMVPKKFPWDSSTKNGDTIRFRRFKPFKVTEVCNPKES